MKAYYLKFMGFLGFLGLLGFATENYGFFGFFGFFSFFAAAGRPDERLAANAYKAGFNGFMVAMLGLSALVTALSMDGGLALLSLMLAAVFAAVIVTFVVSMIVLERSPKK